MPRLESWVYDDNYFHEPVIWGYVYDDDLTYGNHPFPDGTWIHTSEVLLLNAEEGVCVTRNTTYKLGTRATVTPEGKDMRWLTADLHFGHRNIIQYTGRNFEHVQDMDRTLLRNMNEMVTPQDDFFILGDLTMHGPSRRDQIQSYIRRMPGRKHLILGNHDRCTPFTYVDMGFETVHTALEIDGVWLVHDPAIAGVRTDDRFFCGHVHSLFTRQGNAVNVGVDVRDLHPIDWHNAILEFEEYDDLDK